MLSDISVKNFRAIDEIFLNPLRRITLIAGKNGSGKTSVLESLWILSGPDLPELANRTSSFRGLPPPSADTLFLDLFSNFDRKECIEIKANTQSGPVDRKLTILMREHTSPSAELLPLGNQEETAEKRSTLGQTTGQFEIVFDYSHDDGNNYISRAWWVEETMNLQLQSVGAPAVKNARIQQEIQQVPGRTNSVFLSSPRTSSVEEDAQGYSEMQLRGLDSEILGILRTLEPRLKSLTTILINNSPVVHAYLGGEKPVATRLLGEGFCRVLRMAVAMQAVRGGILLIDEIENGLHHSIMGNVFSELLALAKTFDVQVIATTHSLECVKAAYESISRQNSEDFAYHRIDNVKGRRKATHFDHEMLETAMSHEMEVR